MRERAIVYRYAALRGVDPAVCIYCGEPAEGRDHVLPIAVGRRAVGQGRTLTDEERTLLRTVPACHSCNSIAADRYHPSILDRLLYIRQRIFTIDKTSRAGRWEPEELEVFGRRLRGYVSNLQLASDRTRARLTYESPILDVEGPCAGMVAAPRPLLSPGAMILTTIDSPVALAALLDDIGVPAEATVQRAGELLRLAGYSAAQSHIAAAVKRRKPTKPTRAKGTKQEEEPECFVTMRDRLRDDD